MEMPRQKQHFACIFRAIRKCLQWKKQQCGSGKMDYGTKSEHIRKRAHDSFGENRNTTKRCLWNNKWCKTTNDPEWRWILASNCYSVSIVYIQKAFFFLTLLWPHNIIKREKESEREIFCAHDFLVCKPFNLLGLWLFALHFSADSVEKL